MEAKTWQKILSILALAISIIGAAFHLVDVVGKGGSFDWVNVVLLALSITAVIGAFSKK